jgi:hypothetical protein
MIAASVAPSFYIGGGIPPERALIIPQFVLVATIMCCGILDGLARRSNATARRPSGSWQRVAVAVGAVVVAVAPLATTAQTIGHVDELRAYAAALDARERKAREATRAGELSLTVPRVQQPSMVLLQDIGSDPTVWPNTCVARYYGLESIVALERQPTGADTQLS